MMIIVNHIKKISGFLVDKKVVRFIFVDYHEWQKILKFWEEVLYLARASIVEKFWKWKKFKKKSEAREKFIGISKRILKVK